METELTKIIKQHIRGYKPKLNSTMRTLRWAEEVWTPTGIVDSIRFEDYYKSEQYVCSLIGFEGQSEIDRAMANNFHPAGQCFRDNTFIIHKRKCHGCVFLRHGYEVGMMVTCYEVKISVEDFKSKNGHNFHGNENYYVVPKEIAPRIEPLVPADVGIIVYYRGKTTSGLRIYKSASWREVDDATKVVLLYNALKKWCDGAVFPSQR